MNARIMWQSVTKGSLFGCWSFTSWSHLRSYQDRYQLATIHAWQLHSASLLGTLWPDIPLKHWANQSLPYPNNPKRLARKQQAYILKSLVWFNLDWNHWVRIPWSPKSGRRTLNSLVLRAGNMVSQWGNTILLSWIHAGKPSPSWYGVGCY